MAIKLINQTNVDPASGEYPYGNIKDNDGSNNGTPLNKITHADFHQFFAKMLAEWEALGFETASGVPDNAYDGFNYYSALLASARIANRELLEGLAKAKVLETYGSLMNDLDYYVLDGLIDSGTAVSSGHIFHNGTIYSCSGLNYGAVVNQLRISITAENTITMVDSASAGLYLYTNFYFLLQTKMVTIGAWNMDTDITLSKSHVISNFKNIRNVSIKIINDDETLLLDGNYTGTALDLTYYIDSTNIVLSRTTGGIFDSVDYDSIALSRGWITIDYLPQ